MKRTKISRVVPDTTYFVEKNGEWTLSDKGKALEDKWNSMPFLMELGSVLGCASRTDRAHEKEKNGQFKTTIIDIPPESCRRMNRYNIENLVPACFGGEEEWVYRVGRRTIDLPGFKEVYAESDTSYGYGNRWEKDAKGRKTVRGTVFMVEGMETTSKEKFYENMSLEMVQSIVKTMALLQSDYKYYYSGCLPSEIDVENHDDNTYVKKEPYT